MSRRFAYNCKVALLVVWPLVAMLHLTGCNEPATLEPRVRPSGIPKDAIWAGGADGGAYVRCTVDLVHDVNPCSVWNDYTGEVVESGNYRLNKEGRAASKSELRFAGADFAGRIYLEKGLVLERMTGPHE